MAAPPIPLTRHRPRSERVIELGLLLSAVLGVFTTAGIILVLIFQTLDFFAQISPLDFFTGTRWSGAIQPYAFGIWPLISGTLVIAVIAMIVAVPLGLLAAILLADYASPRVRNVVKPMLETIAGIPTIVFGFFAINFLAPQVLKPLLGSNNIGTFSALSAGIVVGLLVTPLIASISEDSMRSVPRGMREGAYAMGATKFEVVRKVVLPAAISGIMASIILAMSRAVGETMAVSLAGGDKPQLSIDPTESIQTMTSFIAQIAIGETAQGSITFKSLFAVGATLFALTLVLNLISAWVVRRFRTVY